MDKVESILSRIEYLKNELKLAKIDLKDSCPHTCVKDTNDIYSAQYNEYVFRCNDCGMEFVTDDPDFKV